MTDTETLCTEHIPAFDPLQATGLFPHQVRHQFPRFEGACTCGFEGIAYASPEHQRAGDWQ